MADMVEAIWQRAGRQLREAGFTPIQAREVIHIMEYILPQSVREQTRLMAKDIAEESTKTLESTASLNAWTPKTRQSILPSLLQSLIA